jgi:integrase/recombinase XerD
MLNVDIIKEFLFDCRMRKLSERTVKSYKNNNQAMLRFISSEYDISELDDTNHIAIKGYIEFLTNKGLAETYINGLIRCFKAYFTYCMREQYIHKNPVDKVYRQKEVIPIIMHDTYKINIESIDQSKDISIREVYGLDKIISE